MGLLDLKTDLKSLKFGGPPASDRPGGGNSNQPYLKNPIDRTILPQSEDSILRGGLSAPLDAANDVVRLTKFFGDLKSPNGILFVAKQNLLSRIGVATQASGNQSSPDKWKNSSLNEGLYTPLSTIAQAGVGFTGAHLYKQGLNPLKGVNTYLDSKSLIVGGNDGANNRLVGFYGDFIKESTTDPVLYSYAGGPNSDLGIGKTNIYFSCGGSQENRTGINNPKLKNTGFFPGPPPPEPSSTPSFASSGPGILGDSPPQPAQSGFGVFKRPFIEIEKDKILFDKDATTVTNQYAKFTGKSRTTLNSGLNTNSDSPSFHQDITSVYNPGTLTSRSDIKTYQVGLENSGTERTTLPLFYSPLTNKGITKTFDNGAIYPGFSGITTGLNNENDGKFGREFQVNVYESGSLNPSTKKYQDTRWNSRTSKDFKDPLTNGVSSKYEDYTGNTFSLIAPNDESIINLNGGYTYDQSWNNRTTESGSLSPRTGLNTYQVGLENSGTERSILPPFYSPLTNKGITKTFDDISEYPKFKGITEGLNNNNDGKFGRTFPINVYESGSLTPISNLNTYQVGLENSGTDRSTLPSPYKPITFTTSVYNYISNPNKTPLSSLSSLTNTIRVNDSRALTWNQQQIEAEPNVNNAERVGNPILQDFRKPLLDSAPLLAGKKHSTIMSIAPSYSTKGIDGVGTSRIKQGSPGTIGNVLNYEKGKTYLGTGVSVVDHINYQPLYKSKNVREDTSIAKNDLVKFRIGAVLRDNKKVYIHFRAFIDKFSDSYSAKWSGISYMGRGEELYKYGGFGRKISLSYTVAAQSKPELMAQYKKLNFLASTLAPDYGSSGYMGGVLTTLTLGGWCYELPGFISDLSLDIPQESPWEIAIGAEGGSDESVKEMPHICKVNMNFTPIHTFRPELQSNTYSGSLDEVSEYGPQHFISLSNGKGNNYKAISLKDAQTE